MAMKKTTSKPPKASGTSAGKSNPKAAAKGKGSLPKPESLKTKAENTVKKLQNAYDKVPKAYDKVSKTPGAFVKGGPRPKMERMAQPAKPKGVKAPLPKR
jgi:hypothetical protein